MKLKTRPHSASGLRDACLGFDRNSLFQVFWQSVTVEISFGLIAAFEMSCGDNNSLKVQITFDNRVFRCNEPLELVYFLQDFLFSAIFESLKEIVPPHLCLPQIKRAKAAVAADAQWTSSIKIPHSLSAWKRPSGGTFSSCGRISFARPRLLVFVTSLPFGRGVVRRRRKPATQLRSIKGLHSMGISVPPDPLVPDQRGNRVQFRCPFVASLRIMHGFKEHADRCVALINPLRFGWRWRAWRSNHSKPFP